MKSKKIPTKYKPKDVPSLLRHMAMLIEKGRWELNNLAMESEVEVTRQGRHMTGLTTHECTITMTEAKERHIC